MRLGFLRHIALLGILLLCSCSEMTRHKVLTTIFDGVPSLPSAEQYCADYATEAIAKDRDERAGKAKAAATSASTASTHPPYAEKLCDNCHDKTAESGFVVKSKTELCFVCHKTFIQGEFVHGPVAVGDCLACHDPHTTSLPHLLKFPAAEICARCHKEPRQAASLHAGATTHGLICVNCHSPHFGTVKYFLK